MTALEHHLRRQIEHSRTFFWHRLRWRALQSHLPADHRFRLVDVGAGAGLLGDFLARQVPRASYGFVEPLESLERYLESRFGAEANYRRRDRYHGVEVVALLDVLEHQEDDRAFLAQLLDRMEPGAVLVVMVPALRSLWSQWDIALGHFRRYDKAMLRRSIEGLRVELRELNYLLPEMVPLAWFRRLVRRWREGGPGSESAEFPDLPKPLNDVLYGVGTVSLRLRRWWPLGTSLLAVLVTR